jgi:hypothetical protein
MYLPKLEELSDAGLLDANILEEKVKRTPAIDSHHASS